jgi:transcription initiation factor TFIID subunit 4
MIVKREADEEQEDLPSARPYKKQRNESERDQTELAIQNEDKHNKLMLQEDPLRKKLVEITTRCGVKCISRDLELCLSKAVEERLRNIVTHLIRLTKLRADLGKPANDKIVITSNVKSQILFSNREAASEEKAKEAPNISSDAEDKCQDRVEIAKPSMVTKANIAARKAIGGEDVVSRWRSLAERSRETRKEIGKTIISTNSELNSANIASASCELIQSRITVQHVIDYLEREPQMAKSTLLFRLYERRTPGSRKI